MKVLSVTDVRAKFKAVLDEVAASNETVRIFRHNADDVLIMSVKEYEALMVTIDEQNAELVHLYAKSEPQQED